MYCQYCYTYILRNIFCVFRCHSRQSNWHAAAFFLWILLQKAALRSIESCFLANSPLVFCQKTVSQMSCPHPAHSTVPPDAAPVPRIFCTTGLVTRSAGRRQGPPPSPGTGAHRHIHESLKVRPVHRQHWHLLAEPVDEHAHHLVLPLQRHPHRLTAVHSEQPLGVYSRVKPEPSAPAPTGGASNRVMRFILSTR